MLESTYKSILCYTPKDQQECKFYKKLATVLLKSLIIHITVLNIFQFTLTLKIIILHLLCVLMC